MLPSDLAKSLTYPAVGVRRLKPQAGACVIIGGIEMSYS